MSRTEFAGKSFGVAHSVRNIAELEHSRIAARIKQARKEKGLTQEQMAQLLDVRQRTYQNYESASQPRIPWDRMNDIERITKKKVEWLLHGDSPDLMGALNGNGITSRVQEQLDEINRKLDELLKRDAAPAKKSPVPKTPPTLPKPEPKTPADHGSRSRQADKRRAS